MSHETERLKKPKSPDEVGDQIMRISKKLASRARKLNVSAYSNSSPSYSQNDYGDQHVHTPHESESGHDFGYLHVNKNGSTIRWTTEPQPTALEANSELYGQKQKSLDLDRPKVKRSVAQHLRLVKTPRSRSTFKTYEGPGSLENRRETTGQDISEAAAVLSKMRGAISEHSQKESRPRSKAA